MLLENIFKKSENNLKGNEAKKTNALIYDWLITNLVNSLLTLGAILKKKKTSNLQQFVLKTHLQRWSKIETKDWLRQNKSNKYRSVTSSFRKQWTLRRKGKSGFQT